MEQVGSDKFNNWIKEISWIRISKKFSFNKESSDFKGEFKVPIESKKDLNFKISISSAYPNQNINFFCLNVDGYEHQMPSGLICHNPDVYFDKKAKFYHEFEKLETWIEKFYIREETSDHYEQLIFPKKVNKIILFPDVDLKYLSNNTFGQFHFLKINQLSNEMGEVHKTFLMMGLDEKSFAYSSNFKNLSGIQSYQVRQGIRLHLSQPPVVYRRKPITKWSDLLNLLTNDQIAHLYTYKNRIRKQKGVEGNFLILLSYPIPNTEKGKIEANFALVEDHVKENPKESKYVDLELFDKVSRKDNVAWGETKNISDENFWGRGALSNKFIKNKILIIGIGAIGSSLAKILVRCGATDLGIIDFDSVEAGNICRSEYVFPNIRESKISALERELVRLNPFVSIKKDKQIKPKDFKDDDFKRKKRELEAYDIIFDCTTDKYLANILDQMNLSARVINLSISNKAKEFVCVTGSSNITSQKTNIYEKLGKDEEQEPFYPEVGCFHPTFEASYNDINLLLNYGIKEINRRLENEVGLQSFVIENSESIDGVKLNLNYDI